MGAMTQTQRQLVAVEPEEERDLAQDQYLTFTLRSEAFAISILRVREIIEYGGLTAVPMMPEYVGGVINLRGRVVPAIDLACRFGRDAVEPTRRTCIIILEGETEAGHQDIGVIVDAVNQVNEISTDDIEAPPSFGGTLRTDFIDGMGKVNGQFVTILNSRQLLAMNDGVDLSLPDQGEAAAQA